MQPFSNEELFSRITELAKKNAIICTRHGYRRTIEDERNMPLWKVKDILLNPKEIVKTEYDNRHSEYKYRIKGGKYNRQVVITIRGTYIWVVTTF